MNAAKWEICDRSEPFGHFAWRNYAKVYCWWSSAFFDFSFTVKRRNNHYYRCRSSFLRYHRSSHTHTPKPNSARRSRRWLPNRGDSEKILPRISFATRSPSYWLFHSSSTRRWTELSDKRDDFARRPPRDIFLLVLCAVRIFVSFDFVSAFEIFPRFWLMSEDNDSFFDY